MRARLFRLAAPALALLMLCGACKKVGPADLLPFQPPSDPTAAPAAQPAPDNGRDRRAALLTALDALDAEEAMYARLCDLNGDGLDDVLILGRRTFYSEGMEGSYTGFCFSGIVWDGAGATVVPFDSFEYLPWFGADSYAVYRDKSTGVYYAGYTFSMDNVSAAGFQSAVEYVPMGFECGYETPEELGSWEALAGQLQKDIDARFEQMETIVFPQRQVYGNEIGEDFYWTQYWNSYGEAQPDLPDFYGTVTDVRGALSESTYGADNKTTLPFAPGEVSFGFASGAGAWDTSLTLHADGTFEGNYHDADMGWSGAGYDSTISVCEFSGAFKDIRRVGEYTWSLTLDTLVTKDPPGKEWIEDQEGWKIRYVASEAYGVAGGTEFLLYTPEARRSDLPEEFLGWDYRWDTTWSRLGCYGLYNLAEQDGFYS